MATTYTTIQGDEWDHIAYKVYGNERLMDMLLEANPRYNRTVVFSQGITLVCPDKPVNASVILPPWKR